MSHFYSIALSLAVSILGIIATNPKENAENIQKQNEICSGQAQNTMSLLVWLGNNGTDWNDPNNWTPSEVPDSGSLTGHHVIIPVSVSGNYPIITGNSFARSVTVASGASVTIAIGGDLKVYGSDNDGYINGGTLVNNGNFRVDSSFNDALRNLVGANITNSGIFTLNSGTGNRLENYSQITNTGSFTVGGGLGINMINHPGSVVINSGTFSINSGLLGRLVNYGKIDNFATFQITGSLAGDGLVNQDSILNRAGATFSVNGGNSRLLDNHHYILNSGTMNLVGCFPIIPAEANYNRENATFRNTTGSSINMASTNKIVFRNEGYFHLSGTGSIGSASATNILNDSLGVMDVLNNLTVQGSSSPGSAALINYGVINIGAATTFNVSNSGAAGIHNYHQINSNSGCVLTSGSLSSNSIVNFEGAVFSNNCSSTFNNSGGTKIINQGRYIHNNGSISSSGGTIFLENSGYCELNVPASFTSMPRLFFNTDTLILNAACTVTNSNGFDQVFRNGSGAYLFSDAQFNVNSMGFQYLENYGKAILGAQSSFTGTFLSSSAPVIQNTDSLYMNGNVNIRAFSALGISNSGYINHSGIYYSHNTSRGIQSTGGTFINSGSMEIDSVFQNAIDLNGDLNFENSDSGSISINYTLNNGIHVSSASSFLNEGIIEIGLTDSLGMSAINNAGSFVNRNTINLGGGRIHEHGINNTGSGSFVNNGPLTINESPNSIHGFGINNEASFINNYCGNLIVNKNISNNNSIENIGQFTINSSENSINTGTFTNFRTLNVLGGGVLPNVIEDELIQLECPDDQIVKFSEFLDLTSLPKFPLDGSFSGPGVQNNVFNSSAAGLGNHIISYNYFYDVNCFQSCTFNIEVIPFLPPGWSQNINGIGCNEGSGASFNDTTQVFSVSSTNCFSGPPYTGDNAAFVQYSLCGDGSITAQVTGITGNGWAGVVMRENINPGAKKAQLTTNIQSNQTRREIRTVTNGPAVPQQIPGLNRFWLRIVRLGNQFTGYTSPNGINWSPAFSSNIIMANCIELGLLVSNYNASSSITATFGNVTIVGGNVTLPANNTNIAQNSVTVKNSNFEVFPNPSSGEINLELSSYVGKSIIIEILSLQGQILLQKEIKNVQATTEKIDLHSRQSGTYLVKVRSEGMADQVKPAVINTSNK